MTVIGRVDFQMGVDRTGLTRGLKRAEGQVRRSSNAMRNALGSVGGALFLRGAINQIAKFEQAMSTVQAVTRATGQQFEALREQAKLLGSTTRFSATQAAEGMLALARAGLNVEQTMKALPTTLKLAQAGALSIGDAADIATNVLAGMRLEIEDLTRVADVLAKTANSSNTDVQQLGQAFSYAAPIANQFGLSVEETAGALGLFSNNGIKADRAGTALNNVLARLTSRTKKGEEILEKYNLGYNDLDVSVRGLVPVLQTLNDANLSVADSMALFAIRGSAGGNILAKQIPQFLQLTNAAKNAAGELDEVADIMDDNLNGAILSLQSAMQGLIQEAGEGDGLRGTVEALATSLRFATENIEILKIAAIALASTAIPALTRAAVALVAALGPIGAAVGAATAAALAFKELAKDMEAVGDTGRTVNEIISDTNTILAETAEILGDASVMEADNLFTAIGVEAEAAREIVDKLSKSLTAVTENLLLQRGLQIQNQIDAVNQALEEERRKLRGAGQGFRAREFGGTGGVFDPRSETLRNIDRLEANLSQLTRKQAQISEQAIEQVSETISNIFSPGGDAEDAGAVIGQAIVEELEEADIISIDDIPETMLSQDGSAPEVLRQFDPLAAIEREAGIQAEKRKQAEIEALEDAAEESQAAFRDMFKGAFKTAIIDGDVGTAIKTVFADRAAEGLERALDAVADAIYDAFSNSSGSGIFGAIAGAFGGAKASGGSVFDNRAYTVGERGAETFVPFKDGTIIPNKLPNTSAPTGGMGGGLVVNNSIVIEGDASEKTIGLINDRLEANAKALPGLVDARIKDRKRRGAY